MPEKTFRIVVKGLVQGVFFRVFAKENADKLGVKGFARNLSGGGVEIFCRGEEEILKDFVEKMKIGPEASKVEHVSVDESSEKEKFGSFEIRF